MGIKTNSVGRVSPRLVSQTKPNWQTIGGLLLDKNYEKATALLQQTGASSQKNSDPIVASLLTAAHQLCLTCQQYHAEIDLHQQAYEQAVARERELREQLAAILDLVGQHLEPDAKAGPAINDAIKAIRLTKKRESGPKNGRSLWQRVRNLLKQESANQEPLQAPHVKVEHVNEEAAKPLPEEKPERGATTMPSLSIYCLGSFRVYQNEELIEDWNGLKGQAILKYLIAYHDKPIAKDILMNVFWPDASLEAARNNLNAAVYSLRQSLRAVQPKFSHILFQDDSYLLNPALNVWIDMDEFVQRFEAGQKLEKNGRLAEAMQEYEIAEGLYQGDFLEEDLYEDWLIPRREGLKDSYLLILDRLSRYYLKKQNYATCIRLCQAILGKDDCREDAHRRLMQCYSRQGQRNLALRQYHLCVKALEQVLDVTPVRETTDLYYQLRNGNAA